jgi:glycosyltransferase involved in cell wall biosynthesis
MGNKQLARSILHLPQNVRLIGCAGRFAFEKGQSVLIEALARLPKRVHLALAGSGEMEKELKQTCLRFNVENRVHFLGQVNDMARFYQSLDIFCLPSYKEGFPLSPLEAQACGIPVVATKTGASCEAVSPDIGEIVEPGDSFAMANGIRRVNKLITRHDYEPSTPRHFVTRFAQVTQMVAAYSSLKHQ